MWCNCSREEGGQQVSISMCAMGVHAVTQLTALPGIQGYLKHGQVPKWSGGGCGPEGGAAMRRKLLVPMLLLALVSVASAAPEQKNSGEVPKYDTASEVTIKGTVDEVKEVPNPKGQIGIYLMVKSGGVITEVRLCPNSFLKEFAVVFNKGDEVKVTGSKVRVDDKEVVLAREIEAGNNKMTLRDKEGVPVWTWLTKG
jgi:hypothetical protein